MEYIEPHWLYKHVKKLRSSQYSILMNSCTNLNFFPMNVVNRLKLVYPVIFSKHIVSVVSLIFLPETLKRLSSEMITISFLYPIYRYLLWMYKKLIIRKLETLQKPHQYTRLFIGDAFFEISLRAAQLYVLLICVHRSIYVVSL